jgi:hypothetical protein
MCHISQQLESIQLHAGHNFDELSRQKKKVRCVACNLLNRVLLLKVFCALDSSELLIQAILFPKRIAQHCMV